MAKKQKKANEGAPMWVMTYGDMMSLLLCFFIMLVALSEIKKEDHYQAIVRELQKAFGMKGGGGTLPTRDDPERSLIKTLEEIATRQEKHPQISSARDPGTEGRQRTVTVVRHGDRFIVGSRITFEPGSADLSPKARQLLLEIADLIRGHNNIVEIRGHAASMEKDILAASAYPDLEQLSFARASAVRRFLTSRQVGISDQRLRPIACGNHEPLVMRVYDHGSKTPNRRVEVVVTSSLVSDFSQPEVQ